MKSSRMEAFSDGVLAVITTIMVLEMKATHEAMSLARLNLYCLYALHYRRSYVDSARSAY